MKHRMFNPPTPKWWFDSRVCSSYGRIREPALAIAALLMRVGMILTIRFANGCGILGIQTRMMALDGAGWPNRLGSVNLS